MRQAPLPGWVEAEVRPIAATPTDPDACEVVGEVRRGPAVRIRCIIETGTRKNVRDQGGGVLTRTTSFRCRRNDATLKGWTPVDGDLIVAQRDRWNRVVDSTRLYLSEVVADVGGPDGADYWTAILSTQAPARRTS